MALKENPEGLHNFPGYSKEGVKIQKILEKIFPLYNYDENDIIKSKPLMDVLTAHFTDDEDLQNSDEELFENKQELL